MASLLSSKILAFDMKTTFCIIQNSVYICKTGNSILHVPAFVNLVSGLPWRFPFKYVIWQQSVNSVVALVVSQNYNIPLVAPSILPEIPVDHTDVWSITLPSEPYIIVPHAEWHDGHYSNNWKSKLGVRLPTDIITEPVNTGVLHSWRFASTSWSLISSCQDYHQRYRYKVSYFKGLPWL